MEVMDSVRALRRRRRHYALVAYRQRLPFSGVRVTLPGGWRPYRQERWFWRIRLGLWIILAVPGWFVFGWPGVIGGVAAGVLVELVASYRWSRGVEFEPGPDGPAGVREPRKPPPTGGAEAVELHVD
ncbi:MAG: hypothetical protein ACRDPO_33165 [Streptosporangiaceae bacterium]